MKWLGLEMRHNVAMDVMKILDDRLKLYGYARGRCAEVIFRPVDAVAQGVLACLDGEMYAFDDGQQPV